MVIQLNPRSNTPIWEQIVNGMKEMIVKEILAPEDKLPSVRELASSLLVNPNTVSKAYQELERQGMIATIRGKGTFVAASVTPKLDEEKMASVQKQLHQILLEATYLGLEKQIIIDWINQYFEELGGKRDAQSAKHTENN